MSDEEWEVIQAFAKMNAVKHIQGHGGMSPTYNACLVCHGDDYSPPMTHKPDCAWLRAKQLVELVDSAPQ